jgi:hypothetical protein
VRFERFSILKAKASRRNWVSIFFRLVYDYTGVMRLVVDARAFGAYLPSRLFDGKHGKPVFFTG